ncbi:MAG: TolC family protein, partial [Bdellovibrionota bacterium]
SEAVDRAIMQNSNVRKAREKVNEINAQYSWALSQIAPTIGINTQYSFKKDSVNTNAVVNFGNPYNNYLLTSSITQPIFDGGAFISGFRVAKKDIDLAQVGLRISERDTAVAVIKAFYKLFVAEAHFNMLKATDVAQRDMLAMAEKRLKIGREQQLDVLQMRAQLALLQPQIIQAGNDWEIAATDFANTLEEPELKEFRVHGSLVAPDWKSIEATTSHHAELPYEIQQAQLQEQELDYKRDAQLAKHYPNLSAFGNFGFTSLAFTQLFSTDSMSWAFGVQLQIPLFSGLSSVFERRQLSSQITQLAYQENRTRTDLSLNKAKALKGLEYSQRKIASAEDAYRQAATAIEAARKTYRLATVTYIQLFTAEQNFFNAETARDQARYDYLTNLADFYVAAGLPLDHLVQALTQVAEPKAPQPSAKNS